MTQTTAKKARGIAPQYNGKRDRQPIAGQFGQVVNAYSCLRSPWSKAKPACLCHHDGEAEAGQTSTSLMHSARRVIPVTAELDRRPTGQHAINFCRAPQKAYTPCGTDAICLATAGGLRARFGGVTCNGSLTNHIVRVSLDPDVYEHLSTSPTGA